MQQRVVTVSAVAGIALFGALAGVQKACSQSPGRPVRAAVSSENPTGQTMTGTVASQAAYGERAGEGRNDTPAFNEPVQAGTGSGASAEGFGRPNPGRPAYEDPEFQGNSAEPASTRRQPQGSAQVQQQGPAQDETGGQEAQGQAGAEGDPTVLTVNDGFFFDNYTSGSGFGVYGGEAVTSGPGQQLNLPSAGVNARNLGLPVLPNQPTGGGQPQQPQDPDIQ